MALAAIGGALLGLVVVVLVDPQGQLAHVDTAAVAIGAAVGVGLDRLLRG